MNTAIDPITSAYVRDVIARVKANTTGALVTNLFLTDSEIESVAAQGGLAVTQQTRAALFFLQDGPVRRVYFAASSPEELGEALRSVPGDGRMLCDVIGGEDTVVRYSGPLEQAGFKWKRRYLRMSRFPANNNARPLGDRVDYDEVETAVDSDAPLILAELRSEFDPETDHLPSLERIRRSIAAGTVLIVRDTPLSSKPGIGVICYWDRTGKAAAISRYWVVRPYLRRTSAGLRAWVRFLHDTADCRRVQLWVREENTNAITIYKFYGFEFDAAVDDIFVRG
jgi:RimJ/RimL family protein N-acetyltransferase